jgi:hypothetical protein
MGSGTPGILLATKSTCVNIEPMTPEVRGLRRPATASDWEGLLVAGRPALPPGRLDPRAQICPGDRDDEPLQGDPVAGFGVPLAAQ